MPSLTYTRQFDINHVHKTSKIKLWSWPLTMNWLVGLFLRIKRGFNILSVILQLGSKRCPKLKWWDREFYSGPLALQTKSSTTAAPFWQWKSVGFSLSWASCMKSLIKIHLWFRLMFTKFIVTIKRALPLFATSMLTFKFKRALRDQHVCLIWWRYTLRFSLYLVHKIKLWGMNRQMHTLC